MITAENLSIETLMGVLKAAFVDATVDTDGDISIAEEFHVYLQVPSSLDMIRFLSQFSVKPDADRTALLDLVNTTNTKMRLPRAYLMENEGVRSVVYDHYFLLGSGISEQTFVQTLRRLQRAIHVAVEQDTDNILG